MEIERTTVINASADHVWELLGPGFANIADWFSGVLASDALPAEPSASCDVAGRVCQTPGGELSERMTNYDAEKRTFSFVIDGLPSFVVEASNTFRVTELPDGRAQLSFRVAVELKKVAAVLMGWMFRRKLNETADQIVSEFQLYAETGTVSERKARLLAKKAA